MASGGSQASSSAAAASSSGGNTQVLFLRGGEVISTQQASPAPLHLVLQPRPQHTVTWTEDTIDNEHMKKKKKKKKLSCR
mmetsp:Transcript_6102/g.4845  ORF Transcript_6102/g.4845 Transcript_6102/m.4845 type:complete len:80 (-) Transcript_6102:23-262(-)